MSQIATLDRISFDQFQTLESNGRQGFNFLNLAKEMVTFQQSFMGLEFVLSKGKEATEKQMIANIFNPERNVDSVDVSEYDMSAMSDDELVELFEDDQSVYYNSPEITQSIHAVLSKDSESDFMHNFNADELNAHDIYPYVWSWGKQKDVAFNQYYILQDFVTLKRFFENAARDKDYVVCFVG
jgi:Domain of unknown function (DUF1877)